MKSWCVRRYVVLVGVLMCAVMALGCSSQITFSREKKTRFTRVISVPDEAVVYMQNLALMRDRITLPKGEHLELVLPNRIINESVQLRSGKRIFKAYNIKKGKYTLIRVRDIRKRLTPGKPLVVEYLTWGMYWSAQYRVDLRGDNKIRVQLGAMIQNHWADLSAMKLTLVAGWVGNSLGRRYLSRTPRHRVFPRLAGWRPVPGPKIAAAGYIPKAAMFRRMPQQVQGKLLRPTRQIASKRSHYQMSFRAFDSEVVKKYKIKRVDRTSIQLKSNFQKSFARYYKRPSLMNPQKTTGYTLYENLRADLQLHEQSFVLVEDVTLPTETYYLWPADRGDYAVVVHKLKNDSKILLPAGMAWLHRRGIYVGQDVCTWTPKGASAHLTTANDGKISVHKRTVTLKGEIEQTILTIRNFSQRSQRVDVFDQNPGYQRTGRVSFSDNPITVDHASPLHRWKLQVAARSKRQIKIRYTPQPPKKAKPKPANPPKKRIKPRSH